MINPTKKSENVLVDGLAGERRAFTIKATGKAFRTLIDGLYENKIGAVVREIMSNGYDSHAAAGIPDAPIQVTAPTNMDPTFRVRDFGVSMSHEDIMDLYSTIFESTKENTNDQVGMFGLGSKSPFAYTDTFSVTAYLDGEKRVYVAHISDDDVPQITHIITEPQGVEPDGVEVSIAVKPMDVRMFHHEITRMILGSDIRPTVNGMGTDIPEPVLTGDGWRILADDFNMGRVAIRQGGVIYPIHSKVVSAVGFRYTCIVDVPIGTLEVTASRESLSLNESTLSLVGELLEQTDRKIRDWAAGLTFENRLDSFNNQRKYDFLTFNVGRTFIDIGPDKPASPKRLPAQSVEVLVGKRKRSLSNRFHDRDVVILVERTGEKVLRKNLRIAEAYGNKRYGTTLILASDKDLPRLVRLLGVPAKNVISLASLPDVQISRNPSGGGGSYSPGVNAAPNKLAKGKFWMEKHGVKTLDVNIAGAHIQTTDALFNTYQRNYYDKTGLYELLDGLDFKSDDVEFFTEKQIESRGLTESQSFMVELLTRAEKKAVEISLQDKINAAASYRVYQDTTSGYMWSNAVNTSLYGASGRSQYGDEFRVLEQLARAEAEKSVRDLCPAMAELTVFETLLARLLGLVAEQKNISLTASKIHSTMDVAVKPYRDVAKNDNPMQFLIDFYFNNNQEDDSE